MEPDLPDSDALDAAIERWMRERPAPAAPPAFTNGVMARVRQQRWQVERYWDLGFNIAIAGGLLLVVAGVLAVIYISGLVVVGRDAMSIFVQGLTTVADQLAPTLPAYVGAFVLTASALGLWWFVEN
jgi:hypothetical protein